MIEQLTVFLENRSGRLAELTRTLGDAGINMHALMVADTERVRRGAHHLRRARARARRCSTRPVSVPRSPR